MQIDKETGRPIIELSNSGLNTFASCPRRFAFKKVLVNAYDDYTTSTAASVGSALHVGLQHYAVYKDKDLAILAMAQEHPIELSATDRAANYGLEASTTTLLQAMEHELFDYDLVYVDTFDGRRKAGIEAKFLVEIDLGPDCPVLFHLRGYIDLILRSPITNRIMPVDIKTTTAQGFKNLEAKYAYDHQTVSYGIPLNALLGDITQFDTAIFAIASSDMNPKAELYTYEKTAGDIEDYTLYLLDKCQQISRYYRDSYFPRHPASCVTYNRLCSYHAHCHLRSLQEVQLSINPSMECFSTTERDEQEEPWVKIKIEAN